MVKGNLSVLKQGGYYWRLAYEWSHWPRTRICIQYVWYPDTFYASFRVTKKWTKDDGSPGSSTLKKEEKNKKSMARAFFGWGFSERWRGRKESGDWPSPLSSQRCIAGATYECACLFFCFYLPHFPSKGTPWWQLPCFFVFVFSGRFLLKIRATLFVFFFSNAEGRTNRNANYIMVQLAVKEQADTSDIFLLYYVSTNRTGVNINVIIEVEVEKCLPFTGTHF